jgi:HEPN domain-containing protein/predicted nucleotidyltransferase
MKKSTKHIPDHIQAELRSITKTLSAIDNVEMVILFGSYARGDFVESDVYQEDHITYEYKSDLDIFVVVSRPDLAMDVKVWHEVRERLSKDKKIGRSVTLIVEDISEVNAKLAMGRYFYKDVKTEGVVLFDSKNYKLSKVKKMSEEERKRMARDDYDHWMHKAQVALNMHGYSVKDEEYQMAAFMLHQTSEAYLTAALLVFTGYRPKSHDLKDLIDMIVPLVPEFGEVFGDAEEEQSVFKLLRDAYVEARYNKNYRVSVEQLSGMLGKVEEMGELVGVCCGEKLG